LNVQKTWSNPLSQSIQCVSQFVDVYIQEKLTVESSVW